MTKLTLERISSTHQIAYSKVNYNNESKLFSELTKANMNLKELNKITNLSRKIEWMTIRSVLLSIHSDKDDIVYNANGKPFFKESKDHLSISHSKEMIAIAIDKNNITGIDIQYVSDKVAHIKHKFLNEEEQKRTTEDPIELTYYWSIKEALFKVYGKKDAFLKENIEVTQIEFDDFGGKAKGTIQCNEHFSEHLLHLKRLDSYVIAYVVND